METQLSQVRFSSEVIPWNCSDFTGCFYRAENLTVCIYNAFETDEDYKETAAVRTSADT